MLWKFRGRGLDLSSKAAVVGIVNITPDSFSDGGKTMDPDNACDHALKLLEEGAALLDLGGESTRPGAVPVAPEEELLRLLPVLKTLRKRTDAPISIDTSKASVAQACLDEGADIINDVTALSGDPLMGEVVSRTGAGLILMHLQGTPRTMQENPCYPQDDVLSDVSKYLSDRRAVALGYGVDSDAIILDPGLGFGKTVAHNLALLRGIPLLNRLGSPLMIGHSRKSFLGKIMSEDRINTPEDRLSAGLAVTVLARSLGALLFRVHEVRPHLESLRMAEAVLAT
jgi:dihydropteroate synthase